MWVQQEVEEGREGSSRSRRRRVDLLGLLGVEGGLLAQVALLVGRVRVDVGLRAREDEDEKSAWARSPRRPAAVGQDAQPDRKQRERERERRTFFSSSDRARHAWAMSLLCSRMLVSPWSTSESMPRARTSVAKLRARRRVSLHSLRHRPSKHPRARTSAQAARNRGEGRDSTTHRRNAVTAFLGWPSTRRLALRLRPSLRLRVRTAFSSLIMSGVRVAFHAARMSGYARRCSSLRSCRAALSSAERAW